ncbi:Cytochrome b-c1 complex subunit [Ooceraea biroi]|uniref:Cytochrome b-c1 complex subunit 8 n=1 Tax=Ooceraea biroi TaxID=2015173 RepID=A0A026WPC7_OOCBI|nr:Cytochrome b-c1 complex subunit [Ooceraea biroi]
MITVSVPGDNSLDEKAFSRKKRTYHAAEKKAVQTLISLAPEEQRAWAKSVTHGIPNLVERIIYALPTVLPGFIMSAVIYKWSTAAHEQYIRKDPKLYENDKYLIVDALLVKLIVWGNNISIIVILEKCQNTSTIPIIRYSSTIVNMPSMSPILLQN